MRWDKVLSLNQFSFTFCYVNTIPLAIKVSKSSFSENRANFDKKHKFLKMLILKVV